MRLCLAISIAAGAGLVGLPSPSTPARLLTIPQEDHLRSRMSPSSASLSADGRYVALKSHAPLLPDDRDDRADIYVVDLVGGAVTLESRDGSGALNYSHPRLSADGRFVAFEEHRSREGLVVLVIRDRLTGTMSRIVGQPDDWTGGGAMNDDGTLIGFASTASSLAAGGDENGQGRDVFTLERTTGAVRRVSLGTDGRQRPRGTSSVPGMSGTGRFVIFTSTADFGCLRQSDPTNGPLGSAGSEIYLRDTELHVTRCISNIRNQPSAGSSYDAVISRDGRFAAFVSESPSLAPDDRNRSADVFLRGLDAADTTLVSRSAVGGSGNGGSRHPAISGDARFVVFQSEASDLVCAPRCKPADEDINLLPDIFLLDRLFGRMQRISGDGEGGWIEESVAPAISADGTVIAFSSRHPIDGRDVDHDFDLFVWVNLRARTSR